MSRILFVVDSLFPLQEAYHLNVIAGGLSADNQCCVCVCGGDENADRERIPETDVPVHFLASDAKLKHRPGALRIQAALRLRKRIQSFGPDIVHAWGQPATDIAAAVLKRNDNVKLISSVMAKWNPQTTLIETLQRHLIHRVDQFIVSHESLKPELLAFDVPDSKFQTVVNCVDSNANHADDDQQRQQRRRQQRDLLIQTTNLPPSSFIAITSADLEPSTRLKDLIWATDLLSCVRDDVHLVILGSGSQHQRLLDFAACTEAADHIHFARRPASATDLIGGADVYWNSHLRRPMGGAMLAAFNAAVAVVSVYGPETSPLIRHQETGFAVNFGARDEFARWTKFLIEKPDAARQLATQGQRHARKNFPASAMIKSIQAIWSQ